MALTESVLPQFTTFVHIMVKIGVVYEGSSSPLLID